MNVEPFLQLGAMGLLAFVIFHVATKVMPAQSKMFSENMTSQQVIFSETLKEIKNGFVGEANKVFVGALEKQRVDFQLSSEHQTAMLREELKNQRHAFLGIFSTVALSQHDPQLRADLAKVIDEQMRDSH